MTSFRGCVLQTNCVTQSNVIEANKKLLENAPKRIGGKKMQMMQIIGLMRPRLTKIWNCIIRIISYRLKFGHYEFIFS